MTRWSFAQPDAAHAGGLAPHRPDFALGEADRLAVGRRQQDFALTVGQRHAHQAVGLVERHRDDAVGARTRERRQRRFLDRALRRRHEDEAAVVEFAHGLHRRDALTLAELQQVDDRLAARAAARQRQLLDLEPVALAAVREAQQRIVAVRDEQLVDEVLVLDGGRHSCRGRRGAAPRNRSPAVTSHSRHATA